MREVMRAAVEPNNQPTSERKGESMTTTKDFAAIPSGAPAGAEIRGVDLYNDIDDETFARIRKALDDHSVVYFRGQSSMSYQRHVDFTSRLGSQRPPRYESKWLLPGYPDITLLSNIYKDGQPIGLLEAGQYWHTDRVFEDVPNAYACLRAIHIPHDDKGRALGGTMFASAAYAYDTLPGDVKARIANLRATHHIWNPHREHQRAYKSMDDQSPAVSHPIVRTHPRTGRKCVFVNQQYTVAVEGLSDGEGRELIDYLCRHITRAEHLFIHEWAVGDVIIWDDCAVQHRAIADYTPEQPRLLHRTAVIGSLPV